MRFKKKNQIIYFNFLLSVDFAQALAFKRSQRNKIAPKVYNRRRLFERPIPNVPDNFRMPPPSRTAPRAAAVNRRRHTISAISSATALTSTTDNPSGDDNISGVTEPVNNQNQSLDQSVSDSQPIDDDHSDRALGRMMDVQIEDQNTIQEELMEQDSSLDLELARLVDETHENIRLQYDFDPKLDQNIDIGFDATQSNIQLNPSTPCLAVVPYGSIPTRNCFSWLEQLNTGHLNSEPNIGEAESPAGFQVEQIKKEPLPLFEMTRENAAEVIELLEEDIEVKFDDDVTMTYKRFPMPFKGVRDDLIKQENDAVSGNLPFSFRVSISMRISKLV